MSSLLEWAIRWKIQPEAIEDLRRDMLAETDPAPVQGGGGLLEAHAQNEIRLEASAKGGRLWRNNNGVAYTAAGAYACRFGLCNESQRVNDRIKSSDLVGILPIKIEPGHVGRTIGVFVAREVKRPGWRYTGTKREKAQKRYIELVQSLGGNAAFCTGKGSI